MRRSLFLFLIAALISFGLYRWLQLNHRLHRRQSADQYTPAEGPTIDPKDVQVLSALDSEYSRLIQAVTPSVVSVISSRQLEQQQPMFDPFKMFFPNLRLRRPGQTPQQRQTPPQDQPQQYSLGSGVIVSREGHILTNHHVIAHMEKIKVQLADGRTEDAQLVGSDEQTDIAVLKISAQDIEPLPLGDSDDVHVGQVVFAIGNPFNLGATVTQGIISAKGRRAIADSGVEYLQTDAAVNQGNSGGPLLNVQGEVVGINSAIFSSQEGNWLGISFAIPANVARRALDSLLKNGRIIRGYLGVIMVDIKSLTRQSQQKLNLVGKQGVIVYEVEKGSPAEEAGLQQGDIILRFNGRDVPDKAFFRSRVAELDLNSKVELTILRGGKEQTLHAVIGETPPNLNQNPMGPQ
ncbi:MAG TPA: trypsin-like peptidase domain-containing protein [Chthoniobacter sp.]|jgi:serine protease Do